MGEVDGLSLILTLSYFATDGQSVSQSVLVFSPSETHDHILCMVKTGRTGQYCNRSLSLSVLVTYVRLYEGRLESSGTHLINQNRNFMEVR
jgi:hypothetical protein